MQSAVLSTSAVETYTQLPAQSVPPRGLSRARLWTGRVFTAFAGLFLLLDGFVKVIEIAPVVQGSAELGYPLSTMAPIGIALLVSTVLYLIPRTAFFGALLLTGYMGGAIATHVRVLHPLFTHTLFPIYVAVLIWAGLALRDQRLAAIVRQTFTLRAP
ncbi:MAG TPA: DoxX family protein [Polyangiaceae bacterium]|nr:DoxX family protein [Polyangiaceae bacterium]